MNILCFVIKKCRYCIEDRFFATSTNLFAWQDFPKFNVTKFEAGHGIMTTTSTLG